MRNYNNKSGTELVVLMASEVKLFQKVSMPQISSEPQEGEATGSNLNLKTRFDAFSNLV